MGTAALELVARRGGAYAAVLQRLRLERLADPGGEYLAPQQPWPTSGQAVHLTGSGVTSESGLDGQTD
jgi:hypothetical protein